MNTKRIYKVHQWSGLIAGLFILMLGITGSVLTFHQELEALEYKKYKTVNNIRRISIDHAFKSITQTYTGWDIRLQTFSSDPRQAFIFQLRRPSERLAVFVHPSSGAILKVADQKDSTVFWILKLHYSLHSGLTGEIIVFIAGLIFILSLITGLIIYRKALLKVLTFRTRFSRTKKRSFASSLHRYAGVWTLLLNLLMALTGMVISYEIVKNGLQNPKPLPIINQTVHVSIDSILQVLKTRQPDFNPSYIRFPAGPETPLVLAGTVDNKAYFYSKFYNTINVNSTTGEIDELKINRSLSSLVRGIHFIDYGNILVKILFCLVGISGPTLAVTGFLLWKWKRKKPELKSNPNLKDLPAAIP